MVRLIDMTGFVAFLILVLLFAIVFRKKSRWLHKIHKPATVLCGIVLLVHMTLSIIDGSLQLSYLVILGTGILSIIGFVLTVFSGVPGKVNVRKSNRKIHITLAILNSIVTVIHIIASVYF